MHVKNFVLLIFEVLVAVAIAVVQYIEAGHDSYPIF